MENHFGFDFSNVRVHTDDRAAESARAVNANAYTAGNHIAFARNKYATSTSAGSNLLAHELTHVIQQASGPVPGTTVADGLSISHPDDAFEQNACHVAATANHMESRTAQDHNTSLEFRNNGTLGEPVIQRQSVSVGDIAGVAGAVFGAASLVLAAVAYARPPEALNPMPTTGGVSIAPFSFNTLNKPVKEPASNRQNFLQAQRSQPKRHKILNLKTDIRNEADVNLALRTDGYNILDASAQLGHTRGYRGGSRESNASINLTATQLVPIPADESQLFEGEKPAPGKKEGAGAKKAPEPSSSPQPAEMMVTITGTNGPDPKPPQAFSADIIVKADDSVRCTRCETTNDIGSAKKSGEFAEVDYRYFQLEDVPLPSHGPGDFGPEAPFKPAKNVPT
jgi:hypothetical protein